MTLASVLLLKTIFYSLARDRFPEKPPAFKQVLLVGCLPGLGAAHGNSVYYPDLVRPQRWTHVNQIHMLLMYGPDCDLCMWMNIPFPWRDSCVVLKESPSWYRCTWSSENCQLTMKSKQRARWGLCRPGWAEELSLPLKMPLPTGHIHTKLLDCPFSAPFCSLLTFRWYHSWLSFYFILLSTRPLLDFPVSLTSPLCRMNPEFWEYALFHPHTSITFIKSADVTSPSSWLFFAQLGIGACDRCEIDTWLYLTVFPHPPFLTYAVNRIIQTINSWRMSKKKLARKDLPKYDFFFFFT